MRLFPQSLGFARGDTMTAKLDLWRQKIKKPLEIIGIIIILILLAVLIILIVLGYTLNMDWVGLSPYTTPTHPKDTDFQRGKTLWDWLQLLIIPVVLAVAGYVINLTISRGEQAATEQRARSEQEAVEKRAETERKIAEDNQREAAYQAYLDHMSDLLLKEHFSELKPPPEDVCSMGRARTLAVLRRLDGERKGCLILFLSESNLYKFIELNYADLSGSDLRWIRLRKAKLCEVNLRNADLSGADLAGADLWKADLSGAILNEATLDGANLSGAKVSEEQLKEAKSFKGSIMSDGSKRSW